MNTLSNSELLRKGESIFSRECGFTDTRHKVNLARNRVSEDILRSIEAGCPIETIEAIAKDFPICKYKTQITIHGLFPKLNTEYVGGYKNLVRNKNGSIGVRWSAIDNAKRRRLYSLAVKCDKWNIVEDSQAACLQMLLVARDKDTLAAHIDSLKAVASRVEAVKDRFHGSVDIYKVPYFSRVFAVLSVNILSFHETDFNPIAVALCGCETVEEMERKAATYDKAKAEAQAESERKLQEWRRKREEEKAERMRKRDEFRSTLALPFEAQWGDHEPSANAVFAIIENGTSDTSPFVVRYYLCRRSFGSFRLVECDASGKPNGGKTRSLQKFEKTIKGYKKVA